MHMCVFLIIIFIKNLNIDMAGFVQNLY